MRYTLLCFLLISNITFCLGQDKITNRVSILSQLLKQGITAQKENKHEQAIKGFKIVFEIPDLKFKHPEDYVDLLEGYAVSSLAIGKLEGLLKKYKEILSIREKLNSPRELSSTHLNISNYYQKTNNYRLANKHAKKAFDYAFELGNSDLKLKTLEVFLNLNSNKEFKEYFKKYVSLKEELIKKNIETNKKANRFNYLNVEKDKEISFLKTDKLNLQNEVSRQESVSLKLGLLCLFIFLIGTLFLVLQRMKMNNILLKHSEKEEVSKEQNDSIKNRLFKVRENLSSMHVNIDTEELNKYSFHLKELEKIEKEIGEIFDEVK